MGRCAAAAIRIEIVVVSTCRMGVDSTRREMLATRRRQQALAPANAVGGQDGLIYDGGGFIFQNGRLVFGTALRRLVVHRRSRAHAARAWRHDLAIGL
jgi:hypothetical protein